ncbi:lycopene beta-cyclase [Kordia periserrulae]|uniref:Lycopene beta-cyclase n=1 Tax=Kordia periserrulae TaxID=701523 RepID=A0A2T6BUY4_9FLAO|nr:lycopene cyclase family protein [Kordia periserrulae]PTX59787.1 lycopene beta-cyclase [Kordia periserrulae]
MKYDYIIAGAGCAGLSLLYRMLNDNDLRQKQILVIDKSQKNKNDRTWCFWEKGEGLFEEIVTHQWKTLEFLSDDFQRQYAMENYRYKMIQGIDFYNFVLDFAKKHENVTFVHEAISSITSVDGEARVATENAEYNATYVFNSTSLFYPKMDTQNSLLQHFEGWVINAKKPVFDAKVGRLMDFRLSQEHGDTFMYVLPTSETEALVEYTLFTKKVLEKEQYKTALKSYIKDYLHIDEYEIQHTEFGIIPMSLAKFSRKVPNEKNIINLGTAGGFTKASSGYTFQFVQKHTENIIHLLKKGKHPNPRVTFRDKMFQWYDRTLLEVILSEKMAGKDIFATIFKNRDIETILAFLGNESSVWEDVKVMSCLPIMPFLTSGVKQL